MNGLDAAAAAAAHVTVEMPAELIARVIDTLGSAPPVAVRHLIDTLVPPAARPGLRQLVDTQPADVAAAVLAGAAAARRAAVADTERIEIVWTGPATVAVPARPTETVVDDLIANAREHITLATYSAGNVTDIVKRLNGRRKDGVDIRLLLEVARSDGTGPDSLADFAAIAPYVNTLVWPRQSRDAGDWSNMHVKVLIQDDRAALVTSANISKAARTHNMELGLLISGPATPAALRAHFDELEQRQTVTSPRT